jgi:undecaprenyl-phosphate galactose phosphotransferase
VASIVGLIILLPLTIFVAVRNYMSGDFGPLFFVQERIGKNGKIFKMYKFRTMVVGAEDVLENYMESSEAIRKEYTRNKKLENDPRITKPGNFLRKTSLDEFPQFINVLKREMTLVGPRPYLKIEKEDMGKYYNCIIKMRPALTGPWQVSGRNKLEFEDRLKLDLEYYYNRTLMGDIKMIFKTVRKILKGEGAM